MPSLPSLLATTVKNRRRLAAFTVFVVLASLDNAAAGVLPPLYAIIARDLAASEASLGLVSAVYLLIVAVAAVGWGYRGDQRRRKPLLLYGTLLWGSAMALTAVSRNYFHFLLLQSITAVGVGAISSIGFSVVSDLVPPRRRGVALSLWSISQGGGAAFGALLASTLGAFDWRWPFIAIAILGFLFAVLYLFVPTPKRGQAEPELTPLFDAGERYDHRISLPDLTLILKRPSNRWLLLQAFFFSLAYGSTIWVPRWAIARVQAEGYGLEVATIVGNLFVALFSIGAFFSIAAGHIGDRWQRRSMRGRPLLAGGALLGSIPFFVLLFFTPLRDVAIPETNNVLLLSMAIGRSLVSNGWVIIAFFTALFALALQATDPPNWAAMITDVNLPEHRGTVIGISRMFRAVANAISVMLTGWIITIMREPLSEPDSYAVGLSLFQFIVIPAALCYLGVSRNLPADIQHVKMILRQRAQTRNANIH